MTTFPIITQSGPGPHLWIQSGANITNHETFAFMLQSAPFNVGALISNVTVFLSTDTVPGQVSYGIDLSVVDENLHPSSATITGNFESSGV